MSLPEPNFIDRDIDVITQEWIAYYEERTAKVLQPAQIERILIDLGAYRENLLRIKIQETAKQNLLDFATGDLLDFLGALVGVERLQAQYSKTTMRFLLAEILDFDLNISTDSQIESKDGKVIFQVYESSSLKMGDLYVDIKSTASVAGVLGNGYLAGEINNLITPIAYIDSVQNLETTANGSDIEDDNRFRERIRYAPEQFSSAGSKGAYIFHALSAHPDIIDVSVISPSAGVVNVYPLTNTGNPSTQIIETVQNYLTQDDIKPLTDFVEVKTPEQVDFTIDATLTLYDYADEQTVIAQAEEVMTEYTESLKKKLGKSVIQTQIIGHLNAVYGVFKVQLNAPNETILETNKWANCTNTNIQVGGVVNE